MESELRQLRDIVSSVLPACLRLESLDVTVGTLYEGQEPSFKLVVQVVQIREDRGETAGWVYELGKRVRAFWSRDDLYIEVKERLSEFSS